MFIKYCVFSLKFCDFSELCHASSAAALVFYLPVVCTHTDTRGETETGQSPEYFKILGKNTTFNEHPVVCKGGKEDARELECGGRRGL